MPHVVACGAAAHQMGGRDAAPDVAGRAMVLGTAPEGFLIQPPGVRFR